MVGSGEAHKEAVSRHHRKLQLEINFITATMMLQIQVLPKDSSLRKDFIPNRVRVFVDDEGKVTNIPSIG